MLYENLIKNCYEAQGIRGRWFDKEPLQMEIKAYFGIPKSASRKQQVEMVIGERAPTKKPDADNIAKIIMDAINGILWRDDKDVTSLMVNKVYSEKETVCVTVSWKEEKNV